MLRTLSPRPPPPASFAPSSRSSPPASDPTVEVRLGRFGDFSPLAGCWCSDLAKTPTVCTPGGTAPARRSKPRSRRLGQRFYRSFFAPPWPTHGLLLATAASRSFRSGAEPPADIAALLPLRTASPGLPGMIARMGRSPLILPRSRPGLLILRPFRDEQTRSRSSHSCRIPRSCVVRRRPCSGFRFYPRQECWRSIAGWVSATGCCAGPRRLGGCRRRRASGLADWGASAS